MTEVLDPGEVPFEIWDDVLPAVISPSLTVPVLEGRPAFGTWQSLALIDPNRDNHSRRIRFSFLG